MGETHEIEQMGEKLTVQSVAQDQLPNTNPLIGTFTTQQYNRRGVGS